VIRATTFTPAAFDGPAFSPNDFASYLMAFESRAPKLIGACVAQYMRSVCNISAN
jgi:hypothetical protein